MLRPPSKGFALSINVHKVQLDAMAEWLEGCITFIDTEISKSDVKDILLEASYRDQDFAQQRIDDAWAELARRSKCLGPVATFSVEPKRLARRCKWRDSPAYSFCLMLALQVAYRDTFLAMFPDESYTDQGEPFERLTTESLKAMGWHTHSTGWSHHTSDSFADRLEAVGNHLGEPHRAAAVERWTEVHTKDAGLDVVCHIPFRDGWAGRPVLLVQCASGENWKSKRHTPDIQQWMQLLELATVPRRGISHPFVELEDAFRRSANCDCLMLVLDRQRLSRPGGVTKAKWTSNELSKDINAWTKSRLPALEKNKAD